jgi:hypothetical protein
MRWEYLSVSVDTKSRSVSGWIVNDPPELRKQSWPETLARLGADGWELVVGIPEFWKTYTSLEHAHFTLKRPAG